MAVSVAVFVDKYVAEPCLQEGWWDWNKNANFGWDLYRD